MRDALLDKKSTDIDLSTLYLPDEIMDFLKKAGIPYKTMGLRFGTVSVFLKGKTYDITTCRRDIKTDGRWAQISYTTDWEEDALRRDFTFNALYLTLDGNLIDFCGGHSDLEIGRVKFIGRPSDRLAEDHLRLLRYYRFWTLYGKEAPDEALVPLFQETARKLDILSPDRVRFELIKILQASCAKWEILLRLLTRIGLWNGLFHMDGITSLALRPLSALGRLWSLFKHNLDGCIKRLGLSRVQQNYLKKLTQAYQQPHAAPFSILDQYGVDILKDWASLHDKILPPLPSPVPLFPLKGEDLKAHGLEGPQLGKTLRHALTWWRSHNGQPSKEDCLAYALERIRSPQETFLNKTE